MPAHRLFDSKARLLKVCVIARLLSSAYSIFGLGFWLADDGLLFAITSFTRELFLIFIVVFSVLAAAVNGLSYISAAAIVAAVMACLATALVWAAVACWRI